MIVIYILSISYTQEKGDRLIEVSLVMASNPRNYAPLGGTEDPKLTKSDKRKQITQQYKEIAKYWNDVITLRKALYRTKLKSASFEPVPNLGMLHKVYKIGEKIKYELLKGKL